MLRQRCRSHSGLLKSLRARTQELAPEVQTEATRLRDLIAALLLAPPEQGGAQSEAERHEDEVALFRKCYYPGIQAYRQQIRTLAKQPEAQTAVLARFAVFVRDAVEFYEGLLRSFEALPRDTSASRGRTLTYLGDLARYRELLVPAEGPRGRDFADALRYYQLALAARPQNGNPHNQLAVLATYSQADGLVVYGYMRALMCEEPWVTARNNLTLLFGKVGLMLGGPKV